MKDRSDNMKESIDLSNRFKPKGKVMVQLFDENGQIINEQKSENFITKTVQRYFDHVMRNVFTRNRVTGGHDVYNYTLDPFHSMVLTDATHPEDPQNEWIRAGNVIGYAGTTGTYSGSDVLRGSYNTSESFTNREQVHIVVDFPSHAGNGTFQSIYFSSEYESLNVASQNQVYNEALAEIQKHNGKIYAKPRTGNYLLVFDDNFNTIEQIEGIGNFNDFWIVGNVIYYVSNTFDITSAPLNDPTNRTLVVTLGERASGIVRHELSGRWYTKYNNTIYVYDSGWNLISSFEDINGQAGGGMTGVFDEGVITDAGTFIWVGGGYDNDMTSLNNNTSNNIRMVGFFDEYIFVYFFSTVNQQRTLRIPLVNIGSRALLDEPVTKGNTQTMKITYDFMLPPMR